MNIATVDKKIILNENSKLLFEAESVFNMIVKLDSADTTLALDTSGGFDVTDSVTNTIVYDTTSGTQTATGLISSREYYITLKGTTWDDYFKMKSDTITECNLINVGDIDSLYVSFFGLTKMTTFICDADLRYVSNFVDTFGYCRSLTSIPTGLFDYNTTLLSHVGFLYTFYGCTSLTTIPTDLFRYTAATKFKETFAYCTALTSIPTDLFRYNTAAGTFSGTFSYCISLTTIPTDLFRYNTTVGDFNNTFVDCYKLQLNRNIFYADGEQTTRFLNKSVNFSNCFNRTSFTGVQGEAPDLWNCNFGTGTPSKIDAFEGAGNSLTSISNYGDIPVDWI